MRPARAAHTPGGQRAEAGGRRRHTQKTPRGRAGARRLAVLRRPAGALGAAGPELVEGAEDGGVEAPRDGRARGLLLSHCREFVKYGEDGCGKVAGRRRAARAALVRIQDVTESALPAAESCVRNCL